MTVEGKTPLLGMTLDELKGVAAELGMPSFAARQMAEWLYLSESSIGKTKYRVAQKLGCTSGELREKLMNLLGMGDFEHLSRQESENVHME